MFWSLKVDKGSSTYFSTFRDCWSPSTPGERCMGTTPTLKGIIRSSVVTCTLGWESLRLSRRRCRPNFKMTFGYLKPRGVPLRVLVSCACRPVGASGFEVCSFLVPGRDSVGTSPSRLSHLDLCLVVRNWYTSSSPRPTTPRCVDVVEYGSRHRPGVKHFPLNVRTERRYTVRTHEKGTHEKRRCAPTVGE